MGKRSNGEGSIRRLSTGSWRGELMDGYTDDGKRNIIRFSGKSRKEVQEKLRAYQRQLEENVHLDKHLSFSRWAELWYADHKSQVRPSTYSSYKYTLALLKEHFGEMPIADILPMHINQFTDKIVEQGYSMSQQRKCRAMLIQIFTAAEDNGLVIRNPARRAKKIHKVQEVGKPGPKKDAFTEQEICLMQDNLPDDLIGNGTTMVKHCNAIINEYLAPDRAPLKSEALSAWIRRALLACGLDKAFEQEIERLMVEEPDLDNNGAKCYDPRAYLLRRDRAVRWLNICGITPADVDYYLGHRNALTIAEASNFKTLEKHTQNAQLLENYVYNPQVSRHPFLFPTVLSITPKASFQPSVAYSFITANDRPVALCLSGATAEVGTATKIRVPKGKKPVIHTFVPPRDMVPKGKPAIGKQALQFVASQCEENL